MPNISKEDLIMLAKSISVDSKLLHSALTNDLISNDSYVILGLIQDIYLHTKILREELFDDKGVN